MLSRVTSQIRGRGFSIGVATCALVAQVVWASPVWADMATYPKMAPLAQYLSSDQATEVALARSAAPASISDKATVMALTKTGYETVFKGSNGFVCLVERSWDMGFDSPEFWNPKIRTPQCLNAAAARTALVLPAYLTRTEWVLSGVSLDEMKKREDAEWAAGKFANPESGNVVYMMSKQQYINDSAHPWYPHVMFYAPQHGDERWQWGDGLPGAPVMADHSNTKNTSIFFVLVPKWSDGTLSPADTAVQPSQHHHG